MATRTLSVQCRRHPPRVAFFFCLPGGDPIGGANPLHGRRGSADKAPEWAMDGIRVNTVAPCYTRTQSSKPALKVGGAFCSGQRTTHPCAPTLTVSGITIGYWLNGASVQRWSHGRGGKFRLRSRLLRKRRLPAALCRRRYGWSRHSPHFTCMMRRARGNGSADLLSTTTGRSRRRARGTTIGPRRRLRRARAIESGQICQRRHNFWPRRR